MTNVKRNAAISAGMERRRLAMQLAAQRRRDMIEARR